MNKKLSIAVFIALLIMLMPNMAFADMASSPIVFILPVVFFVIAVILLVVIAVSIIRLVKNSMKKKETKQEDQNL